MKIGISFPYDAGRMGGVQEFSSSLAIELMRRGHDVTLIGPGLVEGRAEVIRVINCAARPLVGSQCTTFDATRLTHRQLQEVRQLRFDALHVHEPLAPIIGLQLIRQARAPVIATFHSAGPTMGRRAASAILRGAGRWLDDTVKDFVAVSSTAAIWSGSYTRTTPRIIPLATPVRAAAHSRTREVATTRAPLIVYVGRNEPRKNLRVLVDAVGLMRDSGQAVRLVVAGWRSELAEAWAENLGLVEEGIVRAVGQISGWERDALLAEADVFCSPALGAESFGLAPLEAHVHGARLVLGDNPGYRDAFGGCPSTKFSAGGPENLARVLADALAAPSRCANHTCQIPARTSFDSVVDEYERVYANLSLPNAPRHGLASIWD